MGIFAAEELSLGPVYHRGPLTLEAGSRTEILGPLLSHEEKGSERSWTVAPLFSYRGDPDTDFVEFRMVYPLMSYNRFGSEYRIHFLQLFSSAGSLSLQDQSKRRFTVFPFYFQQRSSDPSLNYTALLPVFGHLKNRLFRDELDFALLPLYLRSRKNDIVTHNYVFPLFHRRQGPGLTGWQLWPLLGAEHKDITTKTNSFGELETVAGHDQRFFLWPFYFDNKLGIGTENPQTQRLLLPFYSLQRSPLRDTSTYLWPLGLTHTEDREKKYREWGAPWPFIVFARGEGKTANRVWPLFGRAKNETLQSDFCLWPIYKYNRAHTDALDRERTRILFFLYSDLVERNLATGTALERTDLWPLFTARRDHNGNERLQIFSLLEPFLPNSAAVERGYSPLWSIWRSEKNAATGAASQSLLWNLYRRDVTPNSKKCSLLFGLFQYQSGPDGNGVRLFYIPISKGAKGMAGQVKK